MLRFLLKSLLVCMCLAVAAAAQEAATFTFDPRGPQLQAPASNTPPEKRCVLVGRVVNALTGEPVKKVNVRLTVRRTGGGGMAVARLGTFAGTPNAGLQGYSGSSEADGTFRIEGIEPGVYNLSGNKSGFLSTNYGAKRPNQMGTGVTLNPGQQLTDITLSLTPQAVLTGKVTDEDGDPVSGGNVQLVWQTWQRGKLRYMPRNGGPINDLGEYRIANVQPGKYYLLVQHFPGGRMGMQELNTAPGKPDIRPVRTYYPGTTALASATQIEVKAGQDMTGLDIRMQTAQTYHVRGKVAGALPEGAGEHGSLSLSPRDEFPMFFGGQSNVKPDGSFDIAGVAPGSYVLNYFVMSGQIRNVGHQNVDVGAGDVDGVALTLTAPGSMRGVVKVEGTPQTGASPINAANIHVSLSPSDFSMMMGPIPNAKIADNGSFTLDNITPGKYYVQTTATATGVYLKSVRYGSADITGKELDLSGGAGGEIEVIYRYGPGEVDGTVQQAQSAANGTGTAQSAPSAQILLVPDTLNADGSGMRFSNTDNNGGFTMKGVPPGHYRAYALEEMNYNELQNPEALKQLQQKGTDVDVKENDKKQVQLPFISSDELQQLFARAGITVEQ